MSSHEVTEWLAYFAVKAERMTTTPSPAPRASRDVEADVLAWFDGYERRRAHRQELGA